MASTIVKWPKDGPVPNEPGSTLRMAHRIAQAALDRLGMFMPDDRLVRLSRFIDACHLHDGQECFDSWLQSIMFSRLSPEAQEYIISEIESPDNQVKKD